MGLRKKRVDNAIITDLEAYRNMSTQELQDELKAEKILLEELEKNEPNENDEIAYDNWLEECSEQEDAIRIIEHFLNEKKSKTEEKSFDLVASAERMMEMFLNDNKGNK